MNSIQAHFKAVDDKGGILFDDKYCFTGLLKKDGSTHIGNEKKMLSKIKNTKEILNEKYVSGSLKKAGFGGPVFENKVICNFSKID